MVKRLSLLAVLAAFAACGGGESTGTVPSSPTPTPTSPTVFTCPAGTTSYGNMTVTIDGTSMSSSCVIAAFASDSSITATGLFTQLQVTFSVSRPGRLTIGNYAAFDATNQTGGFIGSTSGTWGVSSQVGGSGTVTITTLTATSAAGSFAFNVVPAPGTTGNHAVTGNYSVTFQFPVS